MTTAKTMAAVLAEHTADWCDWCDWAEDPDVGAYYTCLCKEARWHVNSSADYYEAHAKHVAEALSAAGFGLVADAKAEALREAAAAALRSVDDIWGSAGRQIVRLSEIRVSGVKVLNGDWDNHLRWNLKDIAREQARAQS